jgi:hypothetical protein
MYKFYVYVQFQKENGRWGEQETTSGPFSTREKAEDFAVAITGSNPKVIGTVIAAVEKD